MLKTKEKKLVENVFTTYLEDRREQRETTYIYRTLIRYIKIQQYSVPRREWQAVKVIFFAPCFLQINTNNTNKLNENLLYSTGT